MRRVIFLSVLMVFVSTMSFSQWSEEHFLTGSEQTYTVPDGVYELQVDVRGAKGGGPNGGWGGRVEATLPVLPGDVLIFDVGGSGSVAYNNSYSGGWNGGGDGIYALGVCNSYGGGGCTYLKKEDGTILIVAGGGGGQGSHFSMFQGPVPAGYGGGGGLLNENGGVQFPNDTYSSTYNNAYGRANGDGGSFACSDVTWVQAPDGGPWYGGDGWPVSCVSVGGLSSPIGGGGGGGAGYPHGGGGGINIGGGAGGKSYTHPSAWYVVNETHTTGYQNGNGYLKFSHAEPYAYITDSSFESFLEDNGMGDGETNHKVPLSSIVGVTELAIPSEYNISNFGGIESFTSLQTLSYYSPSGYEFIISDVPQLSTLNITGGSMEGLTLENLPNLSNLNCSSNNLTTLDLTNVPTLSTINCSNNNLTDLSISSNSSLTSLDCSHNSLQYMSLNTQFYLNSIICNDNNLESLTIQNGANSSITSFNSVNNPNLICCEVSDVSYANANFTNKDADLIFSISCQQSLGCSDPTAVNYNSYVIVDDGSCHYSGCAQWASSVIDYSSQYSSTSASAEQILGPPDVGSYGSSATAWGTSSPNSPNEYITVSFDMPTYAYGCVIVENANNGFVSRIDVINLDGEFDPYWIGDDPSDQNVLTNTMFLWPQTGYLVQGLRIYCDNDQVSGWNEIDAVQLLGSNCYTLGCTEWDAANYQPEATYNDGTCLYPKIYIPDDAFEQIIEDMGYGDGLMNDSMYKYKTYGIGSLHLENSAVTDLTGLSEFENLTHLRVQNTNVSEIYEESFSQLQLLNCSNTLVDSLNLSNTPDLHTVIANQAVNLQYLDIRKPNPVMPFTVELNDCPNLYCVSVNNVNFANEEYSNDVDPHISFSPDCNIGIYGCTDSDYAEYNQYADVDDGTCATNIAIKTYVPDNNFEAYLEANGLGDGILENDSVITSSVNSVTHLDISEQSIQNVEGLQDFVSLMDLNISDNPILSIDLSSLTYLYSIFANNTLISEIDFSSNSDLGIVVLYNSVYLNAIDLSNNPHVIEVWASNCPNLSSLDLRNGNNSSLQLLYINQCPSLTCVSVDIPEIFTDSTIEVFADLENVTFSTDCNTEVYGCTAPNSFNYNPSATLDDGTCNPVEGITGCEGFVPVNTTHCYSANTITEFKFFEVTFGSGVSMNVNSGSINTSGNDFMMLRGHDGQLLGLEDINLNNAIYYDNGKIRGDLSGLQAYTPTGRLVVEIHSDNVWNCSDFEPYNANYPLNFDVYCGIAEVFGCTDDAAANYNDLAHTDDGSCVYSTEINVNPMEDSYCYGDMDEHVIYYHSANAGVPLSIYIESGATEPEYDNFYVYDGSDITAPLLNSGNTYGDFSGQYFTGTSDYLTLRYTSDGSGSCSTGHYDSFSWIVYPTSPAIEGCTNENAANYNPIASVDDGSCLDNCTLSLTETVCYGNFEELTYSYIAEVPGNGVVVNFLSGFIEEDYDALYVYDGQTMIASSLGELDSGFEPGGYNGSLSGLSFQSESDTLTLKIISDDGICCETEDESWVINFEVFCGVPLVEGCTNSSAVNYDPNANHDNGSCVLYDCGPSISNSICYTDLDGGFLTYEYVVSQPGATLSVVFNSGYIESEWDALYVYDGSTLIPSNNGITEAGFPAGGYYGNLTGLSFESESGTLIFKLYSDDGISCETDGDESWVINYEVFCGEELGPGCTNEAALNYDEFANADDGSCVVPECTDATPENGSHCYGDHDYTEITLGSATSDVPVILNILSGATEPSIDNMYLYDGDATSGQILNSGNSSGELATEMYVASSGMLTIKFSSDQSGSCATGHYAPIVWDVYCGSVQVFGCTDSTACNYDTNATASDGSCTYPPQYYNCDDSCVNDSDGDGYCDEFGCTDLFASNYDANALESEPLLCEYTGCGDVQALNYFESADLFDNSLCYYELPKLLINEIHYNPCIDQGADSDWSFVEIHNYGSETIDLSGFKFNAYYSVENSSDQLAESSIPFGTSLEAGGFLLLVSSTTAATNYNGSEVLEVSEFDTFAHFSALSVYDKFNNVIDEVSYQNSSPWPIDGISSWGGVVVNSTNGGCSSLEYVPEALSAFVLGDDSNENSLGTNWQASWVENGTPGGVNSTYFGCVDPTACNYDSNALFESNDGCSYDCYGCTYVDASNYSTTSTIDDGSCVFVIANSCPTDLDEDGVVATNDLLLFLSTFGNVCD